MYHEILLSTFMLKLKKNHSTTTTTNHSKFYNILTTGPPPAAHARPSGLKRHSRREDAFKEGNFSKKCTNRQTYYVLYNIDLL